MPLTTPSSLSREAQFGKMEITNVTEYEAIAKEKLPKMVYDYYASGAEDQWTLQENRNAFARILLVFFCSLRQYTFLFG